MSEEESYLDQAQSEMNMSASDLRDWQETEAYKEYAEYRDDQRYKGYTDSVVDRAVQVAKGEATERTAQKVHSFLERAKGQFDEDGAGSRKFSGTAKNVVALRNWGYDPYNEY